MLGIYNGYTPYSYTNSYTPSGNAYNVAIGSGVGAPTGVSSTEGESKVTLNPGESTQVSPGRKSSPAECQTCKERKYRDGSDEMVSFKSASHISPEASASRVRAHEQEHVNNAYSKASQKGGKVLSCNVSLKTAICPECGRSYVAGGTTATKISYPGSDKNPYMQNRKSADRLATVGNHINLAG